MLRDVLKDMRQPVESHQQALWALNELAKIGERCSLPVQVRAVASLWCRWGFTCG
jgi:hypothetical protein